MNSKFNEIEGKNMEFLTKLYKIELDTSRGVREFEESMNDFNNKTIEQLLLINNNIEELNKKLVTTKEELDLLKKNEKKYKSDIAELKNYFKNYFDNNNIYSNNVNSLNSKNPL